MGFKREVEGLKEKIQGRREEVEGLMEKKKTIRRQIVFGRALAGR